MAVTSIWSVKGWLGKLVLYVENPKKTRNPKFFEKQELTDKQMQGLLDVIDYATTANKTTKIVNDEGIEVLESYVSGINCSPITTREEMMAVKKRYGKDEGVMAYHGYQSFAPGEATPAIAHEIGVKLAEQLWGDKYQVLVATHLDKQNHLHNHFVLNNVSFINGIRYHRTEKDYYDMRICSDRLCKEYNLSIIENPKRKSKHYGEWRAEQEGRPTWRGLIKADVDEAIRAAMTEKQFFYNLRQKGYEIKFGKDITVRPPGKKNGMKLARNLGEEYTEEVIKVRILDQRRPQLRKAIYTETKVAYVRKNVMQPRKIGGLRGLYLHYCYCLGILPRNREAISTERLHFLLREDLRRLDIITKETRLLCTHHIDTTEQLLDYQGKIGTKMQALSEERKHLRYQVRRIKNTDSDQTNKIKTEISILSDKLNMLRREMKLCEGVMVRSEEIKQKLKVTRQKENREKEGSYDKWRGGRRPNR